MTNSRRKGAEGEREIAKILREYGHDCRRGVQYCGTNGDADVVGLEGIHIECKRVEKLNIDNAMKQARHDCKNGDMPAVFHRKNGESWKVTMELSDWIKLYQSHEVLEDLINDTDVDYVCSYMMECGDWCGVQERDEMGDCMADMARCYVEYLRRKRNESI